MVSKYKLNDLAKNLNVTAADINAVLGGDVVRKPNTVLTEEELNLVFEHFTQANAVESFNDYFASADEPDEKPAEKTAEAKKEEKKPAEKKAAAKPAPKQEEKKPAQKPAAAKQEKKQPEKPAAQTKPAQPAKQPAKPVEKKEKPAEKKPAEQVVRRVDTRTVEVNLDKYNEHYDQLAPQQNKRSDSF